MAWFIMLSIGGAVPDVSRQDEVIIRPDPHQATCAVGEGLTQPQELTDPQLLHVWRLPRCDHCLHMYIHVRVSSAMSPKDSRVWLVYHFNKSYRNNRDNPSRPVPPQTMIFAMVEKSTPSLPLMDAVRSRNREIVSQLATNRETLKQRTQQGYTALHLCSIYNDAETARILIEYGAEINAKDGLLRSPLQLALAAESAEVTSLLVEKGCSIHDSVDLILSTARRA
jgi:hypothetical protein